MLNEYSVPKYFKEDYFDLLNGTEARPSYRWLLVGPSRAGATFHKDPNWTNAWNGLIRGKKKWIFYPPDTPPLGVIPSPDGLTVTVPSTMVQWFIDFYPKKTTAKRIECIQNPGDLIFIPSGWWHSVINLEPSIALTQNFVADSNLKNVFTFLKTKQKSNLSEQFSRVLQNDEPELFDQLLEQIQEKVIWDEDDCSGSTWTLG